ncbi:zinc finger protein ZAT5 [Panicum miliaceum]|uniref:Zinc finger protein ZAT5 n=1 Tax=Panicum miliaceum TaxID=4540 RepID=A0A3L6QI66_PANMI|nr:zinc finger protein ZAT5 [Panicum miliaceum]
MHTPEAVEAPETREIMIAKPPPLVVMPTSSTEHSAGELDRHQQPPLTAAVKRKRTKRPRHHPPASSASSSESTTTEEEDMAHCLILLAQGASGGSSGAHAAVDSKPSPSPSPAQQQAQPSPPATAPPPAVKSERYTSRKYTEAATTVDGVKAGFYVYECKTCNKCFPTFQALGGHRASHKKPRLAGADDEIAINVVTASKAIKQQKPPMATASPPPPPPALQPQMDVAVFPDVTTALSLNSVAISSSKQLRVHECSICGAEFASGQALGGHMRRHRPLNAPERAVTAIAGADTKKEGSAGINLELDLNLPAPSDEEAVSVSVSLPAAAAAPAVVLGLGQFSDGKKAGLMLTASALVDCHY